MADNNSVLVPSIFGFLSTSVDDFAVMLIYFAQAQLMENSRDGYIKVIVAQTMAFTAVIAVSLLGILLGVLVPMSYVDLIGILPLLIGIVQCYELCTEKADVLNTINGERYQNIDGNAEEDFLYSLDPPQWFEEENISLIHDKSSSATLKDKVGINSNYSVASVMENRTCLDKLFDPFFFEVLVFALVCSCDNIAIYVAMFAAMKQWEVLVIVLLFYVLLGFTVLISIFIVQVSFFDAELCLLIAFSFSMVLW
jgi:cadmium resistance protein CadD (predicted permease)